MRKTLILTLIVCAVLTTSGSAVSTAISAALCKPVVTMPRPDPVGRF